jgi:signal peptidase I
LIRVVVGLLGLAVAASTLVVLRRRLFVVTVRGGSMEPALRAGDRLLARRRVPIDRIRSGDVVVLERPDDRLRWTGPPDPGGRLLIKRVAAVPGDPAPRDMAPALARHPDPAVPAGHLVAFGDNRRHSLDSQQIGYFPADQVVGVVLRRIRGEPAPIPRPGVGTVA